MSAFVPAAAIVAAVLCAASLAIRALQIAARPEEIAEIVENMAPLFDFNARRG